MPSVAFGQIKNSNKKRRCLREVFPEAAPCLHFFGALALGCEALLVRLNHLLERVSRTTFEFFEIPHGAFVGEKFDLQLNFIIIDRYKDAVDIFLHKVAVDEPVHRIVASGL